MCSLTYSLGSRFSGLKPNCSSAHPMCRPYQRSACSSQNGTQPRRVSAKNTLREGNRSKTPEKTNWVMPIEGLRPKLHTQSRRGRRISRMISGSSLGYLKVGSCSRGPERSNVTCTVTGMFMSTAAAQNLSSSGSGKDFPFG